MARPLPVTNDAYQAERDIVELQEILRDMKFSSGEFGDSKAKEISEGIAEALGQTGKKNAAELKKLFRDINVEIKNQQEAGVLSPKDVKALQSMVDRSSGTAVSSNEKIAYTLKASNDRLVDSFTGAIGSVGGMITDSPVGMMITGWVGDQIKERVNEFREKRIAKKQRIKELKLEKVKAERAEQLRKEQEKATVEQENTKVEVERVVETTRKTGNSHTQNLKELKESNYQFRSENNQNLKELKNSESENNKDTESNLERISEGLESVEVNSKEGAEIIKESVEMSSNNLKEGIVERSTAEEEKMIKLLEQIRDGVKQIQGPNEFEREELLRESSTRRPKDNKLRMSNAKGFLEGILGSLGGILMLGGGLLGKVLGGLATGLMAAGTALIGVFAKLGRGIGGVIAAVAPAIMKGVKSVAGRIGAAGSFLVSGLMSAGTLLKQGFESVIDIFPKIIEKILSFLKNPFSVFSKDKGGVKKPSTAKTAIADAAKDSRILSTVDTLEDSTKSKKDIPKGADPRGGTKIVDPKDIPSSSKAIGKPALETAGKAGGKSVLKKIPGVSIAAGAAFAADRASGGDYLGAGAEFLSGLLGTVPLVGTAGSVGIDAWLLNRDLNAGSKENLVNSGAVNPEMFGDDEFDTSKMKSMLENGEISPKDMIALAKSGEFDGDEVNKALVRTALEHQGVSSGAAEKLSTEMIVGENAIKAEQVIVNITDGKASAKEVSSIIENNSKDWKTMSSETSTGSYERPGLTYDVVDRLGYLGYADSNMATDPEIRKAIAMNDSEGMALAINNYNEKSRLEQNLGTSSSVLEKQQLVETNTENVKDETMLKYQEKESAPVVVNNVNNSGTTSKTDFIIPGSAHNSDRSISIASST